MNSRLYPIVLLLFAAATASASDQAQAIIVTVSPATVEVAPAEGGRRFLTLPDLEYRLLLEPRCIDDYEVSGLSLSVADSRLTVAAEQLTDPVIETLLTVPAEQLAPLPVAGFCVLPDPENLASPAASIGERLVVPAAASVQAALLCVNEDQRRMTYSAAALDIELRCSPVETLPPEAIELE